MEQLYLFLQNLKHLQENREDVPIGEESFWKQQHNGRIHKVCQYIVDHCDEPISLSTVADSAYLSPEAFCRYFKKHTGFTFKGYLNRVRVAKSCEMMLADRAKTLITIAYSCGFGSVSSFNRAFKKIMEMTPTEYIGYYSSRAVVFNPLEE